MSFEGRLARQVAAKLTETPEAPLGQNNDVIPAMHFEVTPGIGGGGKPDNAAARRGVLRIFGRRGNQPKDIATQTSKDTAAGKDEARSEAERNDLSDEAVTFIGADNLKKVRQNREYIERSAGIVTTDDPFPHAPDRIKPIPTVQAEENIDQAFNRGREYIDKDTQRTMTKTLQLFYEIVKGRYFPRSRAEIDRPEFDEVLTGFNRTARGYADRLKPNAVELEKEVTGGQEEIKRTSKETERKVRALRKEEPKMDTESVLSTAEKALHDMGDIVDALPSDDLVQAAYNVVMFQMMSISVYGVVTGGKMDKDKLWTLRNYTGSNFILKEYEIVARALVNVAIKKSEDYRNHRREDSKVEDSQRAITTALNASDEIRLEGSEAHATLVSTVKDHAAQPLTQMSEALRDIHSNLTTYLGEQGVQQDDPARLVFGAEIEGYLKKQAEQLAYGYTRLGIPMPPEIALLINQAKEQALKKKMGRQENGNTNGGHTEPQKTVEVTKEVKEVTRKARRALVADIDRTREPDARAMLDALRGQELTGLEKWLLVRLASGAGIGDIAQALDAINQAATRFFFGDPEIMALSANAETETSHRALSDFAGSAQRAVGEDQQGIPDIKGVLLSVIDRLQNLPADAREGISKKDIAWALGGAGGENAERRAEIEERLSEGLANIKDYLRTGVIGGEPVEVYPGDPPEGYDKRGRKIGAASGAAGGQQQEVDPGPGQRAAALEDAASTSEAKSWQEKFLDKIGAELDKTPEEKQAELDARKAATGNNLSENADQQAAQDPEPDKAISAFTDVHGSTTPKAEPAQVQTGSRKQNGRAGAGGGTPESELKDDFDEEFSRGERAELFRLMDDPESVTRPSKPQILNITFSGGEIDAVNEASKAERLAWNALEEFLKPWEDGELFRRAPVGHIDDDQLVELLANLSRPRHESRRTTRPDRPSRSEPIFHTERIRWAVMLGKMPGWTLYLPKDSLFKHYLVAVGPYTPPGGTPEPLAVCEAGPGGNATYGLLHLAPWEEVSRKMGKQQVREEGYGFKENHTQPGITEHHEDFFDKARQARRIIDRQREKAAARAKEPTLTPAEGSQKPEVQSPTRTEDRKTAEPQAEVPGAQPAGAGETPLSHPQQGPPTVEAPHTSSNSATEIFNAPIVQDVGGVPRIQPTQPMAHAPVELESASEIEPTDHPLSQTEAAPPPTQLAQAPAPAGEMPERQAPPVQAANAPESQVPSSEPEVTQPDQLALEQGSVATDAPAPQTEAMRQPVPPAPHTDPLTQRQENPAPEQDIVSRGDAAEQTFKDRETNGTPHGRAELPEPSRQEPPVTPDPTPSPSQDMGPDTSLEIE